MSNIALNIIQLFMGQHLNISTCFCEFYQHCLILDVSCSLTLVVLAWYAKCHIMMPIVGGDAWNGDLRWSHYSTSCGFINIRMDGPFLTSPCSM
jgi:hypothetical protein